MTAYEEFMQTKRLVERAENLTVFDDAFIHDVQEYMQMYIKSGALERYVYTKKDGSVFKYPILGFIGNLGLSNVWWDSFPTCCRYAVLEQSLQELEEGEKVFNEVFDRIEQAKKVMHQIPAEKRVQAEKKLESLKVIMNYLMVGLNLVQDMLEHLNENKGYLDVKDNEAAWLWKKYVNEH